MSVFARARKQRKRTFNSFKENAVIINGIYVFQIHEVPAKIEYGCEFDYWVMDEFDMLLLRIVRSRDNNICFVHQDIHKPIYCIMNIDVEFIDLNQLLTLLKEIGIPYKMHGQLKRKISTDIYQRLIKI